MYNFKAPTKTEVPSPEENRVMQTGGTPSAVPKTLPKSANAPTQPTVLAADRSSTGNNLQENCADSIDTANHLARPADSARNDGVIERGCCTMAHQLETQR